VGRGATWGPKLLSLIFKDLHGLALATSLIFTLDQFSSTKANEDKSPSHLGSSPNSCIPCLSTTFLAYCFTICFNVLFYLKGSQFSMCPFISKLWPILLLTPGMPCFTQPVSSLNTFLGEFSLIPTTHSRLCGEGWTDTLTLCSHDALCSSLHFWLAVAWLFVWPTVLNMPLNPKCLEKCLSQSRC
jgi:hypothetical protein